MAYTNEIPHEMKEAIVKTLLDLSAISGIAMETKEITFQGMSSEQGYTYESLWLKDNGTKVELCVECPVKTSETGDKEIGDYLDEKLFEYLIKREAERERLECMKHDPNIAAHQFGTLNTIWNYHLTKIHPEASNGIYSSADELRIATTFEEDKVEVLNMAIVLKVALPESIQMTRMPYVKDIIALPFCGNEEAQRRFEEQFIYDINVHNGVTTLRTGTMTYQVHKTEDTYPWDELLAIRKDLTIDSINTKFKIDCPEEGMRAFARKVGDKVSSFYKTNGRPAQWYGVKKDKAA